MENDAIQQLFITGLQNKLYSACAIQVFYQNASFYSGAWGLADPRTGSAATLDTLFDLASITKIFTAGAFVNLANNKLISLDDPISMVVPSVARDKKGITFRHLLTHSSGLPASFNLYENQEWKRGKNFVIQKIINTPLINKPGTTVVYSCLGFMLLGFAIELIAAKSLDLVIYDFLLPMKIANDVIYKPCYLHNEKIAVTTYTRPNRGNLELGVVHDGNAIAMDNGVSGNAGLFGRCIAVATYGQNFLTNHVYPGNDALRNEMVTMNAETDGDRRGLGWRLWSNNINNPAYPLSKSAYGHSGFTGTSLWIDPERQLVISVLTNSVHYYTEKSDVNKFHSFIHNIHKSITDKVDSV
jgi:CubicO group peptidase (beta-lactamase class C family)